MARATASHDCGTPRRGRWRADSVPLLPGAAGRCGRDRPAPAALRHPVAAHLARTRLALAPSRARPARADARHAAGARPMDATRPGPIIPDACAGRHHAPGPPGLAADHALTAAPRASPPATARHALRRRGACAPDADAPAVAPS